MKSKEYYRRMNGPKGSTTIDVKKYLIKHNLIEIKMTFIEWLNYNKHISA